MQRQLITGFVDGHDPSPADTANIALIVSEEAEQEDKHDVAGLDFFFDQSSVSRP